MLGYIIGFAGTHPTDKNVKQVLNQIRNQQIGGVILYGYNIQSPNQLLDLTSSIKEAATHIDDFIIAVDNEGGKVQRLSASKGFDDYPSAHTIATEYSIDEAYKKYSDMAKMLKQYHFNLNFGPVIDLHDTNSEAIGAYHRSYSSDPKIVVAYAKAFINAHRAHGLKTCLKHYPGHGYVVQDSHRTMPDATDTYQKAELLPFRILVQDGYADAIMTAHIINKKIDALPVTLSSKHINILKDELGFQGMIIADDINMGALLTYHHRGINIAEQALRAGCTHIIKSNNTTADISYTTPAKQIHHEEI